MASEREKVSTRMEGLAGVRERLRGVDCTFWSDVDEEFLADGHNVREVFKWLLTRYDFEATSAVLEELGGLYRHGGLEVLLPAVLLVPARDVERLLEGKADLKKTVHHLEKSLDLLQLASDKLNTWNQDTSLRRLVASNLDEFFSRSCTLSPPDILVERSAQAPTIEGLKREEATLSSKITSLSPPEGAKASDQENQHANANSETNVHFGSLWEGLTSKTIHFDKLYSSLRTSLTRVEEVSVSEGLETTIRSCDSKMQQFRRANDGQNTLSRSLGLIKNLPTLESENVDEDLADMKESMGVLLSAAAAT
ncbi:hypothetical protein AAMO2058_001527900 [Amorphochlora amoebiformis]